VVATSDRSPLRRTVTSRSPSWVGSTVWNAGSTRAGFFSGPKCAATRASVVSASMRPATISSALSGWYQVR